MTQTDATYIIPLTDTKPPMTSNTERTLHWAERARIVKALRHEARFRCRSQKVPVLGRIAFVLHYQPRDRRRRDRGNLYPMHKALLDGVVDAGVVVDDAPEFVDERMPVIHPPVKGEGGRMWVEIIPLPAGLD